MYGVDHFQQFPSFLRLWGKPSHFLVSNLCEWLHKSDEGNPNQSELALIFIGRHLEEPLRSYVVLKCQVNCTLKSKKPCKSGFHRQSYEQRRWEAQRHVCRLWSFLPIFRHCNAFRLFAEFKLRQKLLPYSEESFFEFWLQHRFCIWNPCRAIQLRNVPILIFGWRRICAWELLRCGRDGSHQFYSLQCLSPLSCVLRRWIWEIDEVWVIIFWR